MAVDAAKFIILGWSMPFFYATSARFAFTGKSLEKTLLRMRSLLLLIVFYTVLYELIHWRGESGMASACFSNTENCSFELIFNRFRNVGNTPGYYMSDLLAMYLLACVANLRPILGLSLAVLAWTALLTGYVRAGGFFLNPLALFCVSAAMTYTQLLAPKLQIRRSLELSSSATLSILLALIFLWGSANYFFAQNDYWTHGHTIALFTVLLIIFFIFGDITAPRGKWITNLSKWGREYAFGIFIFHQLCYDLLGSYGIFLLRRLFDLHNSLGIYLLLGIITTLASVLLTMFIKKTAPRLLAI